MKKHFILLWIENPGTEIPKRYHDWEDALVILANVAKEAKNVQTLAPSVWLIPRDSGLPFVAQCMERARLKDLKCHTKFVDEET